MQTLSSSRQQLRTPGEASESVGGAFMRAEIIIEGALTECERKRGCGLDRLALDAPHSVR